MIAPFLSPLATTLVASVLTTAVPQVSAEVSLSASTPAKASVEVSWVDSTLAELSLREKVAQMVMPWIPGGMPARGSAEWRRARSFIEEHEVGGLILGKGPGIGSAEWLNELQSLSKLPLLISADLEWGPGMRLEGATVLPVNMAIGATGKYENAREAGRITALEARAAGIHMIFAPVADVNVNPANPVINTRSYGADPIEVAEYVANFIEGVRAGGALSVVKHFPGHGDTDIDSHLELPVLSFPRSRLELVEFVPFRAAMRAGVDGVMTGHLEVPALEPEGVRRPATLSPSILTDLLRKEMRFGGLVVTDGLMMDGVHQGRSSGVIAVEAVKAGVDILLMPPGTGEAIDSVVAAVERGEIPESQIDASVRRLLTIKAEFGLHHDRLVDPKGWETILGAPEHREWAERTAAESLTLVRAEEGWTPEVRGKRIALVVYNDVVRNTTGSELARELGRIADRVEVYRVSRRSNTARIREVERAVARADVVIFASFMRSVPWRGELGIPGHASGLADRLAERGALIISFGDPYLLRQIPNTQNYLIAWSSDGIAQRAAARALGGEVMIAGRLPVSIPPGHLLGQGITIPTEAGGIAVDRALDRAGEASRGDGPDM